MAIKAEELGLTVWAAFWKRAFDVFGAFIGLFVSGWLILLAALISSIDTGLSGFFLQERVGLKGKRFFVIKIRTMRKVDGFNTTVTTDNDPRITSIGRFLRKTKIDELPQLINVFKGDMSFVGPRPDVPEVMDSLAGNDKLILAVRPGITGPATLKYRDEEKLLAQHEDPEKFNREVIFPDKIRINRHYVENYSFIQDIKYLIDTVFNG